MILFILMDKSFLLNKPKGFFYLSCRVLDSLTDVTDVEVSEVILSFENYFVGTHNRYFQRSSYQ